jgi:hypothetical protein
MTSERTLATCPVRGIGFTTNEATQFQPFHQM